MPALNAVNAVNAMPWDVERADAVVDDARALALVQSAQVSAHWPALLPAPKQARVLGVGWDNTVVVVNDALVVRFPRRQFAADAQPRELATLRVLAERLPVAVPRPLFTAHVDAFPWPIWGHALLAGAPLLHAHDDARRAVAGPLGALLRALHDDDTRAALVDARLPHDTLARTDFGDDEKRAALAQRLSAFVDDAVRAQVLALFADARHEPAPRACVVHGDLDGRHVLVDEGGALSGVIDWDDVHAGDPAVDVAIAYTALPTDARAAFWDAYAPDPADRERLERVARRRALAHTAAVGWYAHEIRAADLLAGARAALARALS